MSEVSKKNKRKSSALTRNTLFKTDDEARLKDERVDLGGRKAFALDDATTSSISQSTSIKQDIGEPLKGKAKRKKNDSKNTNAHRESKIPAAAVAVAAVVASVSSNLSDYEKCSIFPQKLMQLLKNNDAPDAIWWLPDGESFAIEPEKFTRVMNRVSRTGKKKVKLDSILRNLYRWGFKKLKYRDLPANALAYSHPKFKRDACVEMQTFSKRDDLSSTSSSRVASGHGRNPPSALARALTARARAGYGENWNLEGAADNNSILRSSSNPILAAGVSPQQQQSRPFQVGQNFPLTSNQGVYAQDRIMLQSMMVQQQQRNIMLQQELMLRERHHQQQASLLEAAAAERAAASQYAAQLAAAQRGAPPPQFPPTSSQFPF